MHHLVGFVVVRWNGIVLFQERQIGSDCVANFWRAIDRDYGVPPIRGPRVPESIEPSFDRVPRSGVTDGAVAALAGVGPGWSAGKSREADDGIIAQGSDGFQRHVARRLKGRSFFALHK